MPLRIAMITTFYPPFNFGGDGISVQRLARGLAGRGHHVTVIHDVDAYNALHRGREPDELPEPPGVEVVRLRSGLGTLSPLLTQQTGRPLVHGRRIRRLLAQGAFDVVHFHNVSLVGGPGILSFGDDAVRLYTAHEHWLVCPTHVLWRHKRELCTARECFRCTLRYGRPPQLWRVAGYLERQLEAVDAFIAMSEFSRDKHREFGFPRDMEVMPYFLPDPPPGGTDDAGARPHERPYFLFVGRLERIKGLDDVIPLFRRYPDAELLVAGEGGHAAALRALGEDVPSVRFLGHVAQDDLARYYRHAVALVVPSVCYESFGIVLVEAFRQSTPVIARRLGSLPEIVGQSGGGELFDTPDDLLGAMGRMQGDAAYRARLGAAGYRAYVQRWCESAVIPRYLDIVCRAAARRPRALGAVASKEVA